MNLEDAFDYIEMPHIMRQAVVASYSQEHRLYHNIEHIEEIFRHVSDGYSEIEILIDAILFHDIVYYPYPVAAGMNEALSIAEFLSYNTKAATLINPFSRNEFESSKVEYEKKVIEAINATAHHLEDQRYLQDTSKLLLDLDLSTFSLPWDEYIKWSQKVEEENLIVWRDVYAQDEIRKGRCLFLQKLNKREKLYYLKTDWEDQARRNIQQDIEMLSQI
jgi:predicted metal-dependent HD superfamily phosphohydrolase